MKNTKEKPFITVMILCYNYGIMLEHALSACAKQTFTNFNILLIDNGSTDNTKEVFNSFKKKYPEIPTDYLYVFPNKGPTHGWNEGLKKAKGEYVLFNDADDWMEPDCLELLANKAIETNADRVTGQYQEVLPDGTVLRIRKFPFHSSLLPTCMLQGSIFKLSKIIENNIFFPEDTFFIGYDYWLSFSYYSNFNSFSLVYDTIYNYYFNPSSITQKMNKSIDWKRNVDVSVIANIDFTSTILRNTKDKKKFNTIKWLLMYNTYASIAATFVYMSKKEANEVYNYIHVKLNNSIPSYYRCQLFNPFFNGYPFKTSLAVYFINILERLHIVPLLGILSKINFKLPMIKKNV